MTNVRFDDVELSTLGFSLLSTNARQMADFRIESEEILASERLADFSVRYDQSSTTISGMLSADTQNWAFHNHDEFLARLDALKDLLRPKKGFRKLVMSGDQPDRYRWARYQSMSYQEQKPVFRLPFQNIEITFQNLEAYWRETNDPVTMVSPGGSIEYTGKEDTKPKIELVVRDTIAAYSGAIVQPVTLFKIDDLTVSWRGTATDGALVAGDVLTIDSESLTATLRPRGTGTPTDVIRYYGYSGPGAYLASGFPLILRGGSEISYIHPRVAYMVVQFDRLYP